MAVTRRSFLSTTAAAACTCERVADTLMPCIESAKYLLPKIKAVYA